MEIPVSEAKAQLTELVRRAEAGDEVVLTRHDQPAVRLVPVRRPVDKASRAALLEAVRLSAAARLRAETMAAQSQDFLYGPGGLPE